MRSRGGSGGPSVAEGRVPGEAAGQEVAGGGEFLSDEPQPEEPSPHGVLGVVGLLGLGAGALEGFGHLAEGQAKLDVAFQLSGVEAVLAIGGRCVELKKAELNRTI